MTKKQRKAKRDKARERNEVLRAMNRLESIPEHWNKVPPCMRSPEMSLTALAAAADQLLKYATIEEVRNIIIMRVHRARQLIGEEILWGPRATAELL